MTVSAVGVILVMIEKVGALSSPSDQHISQLTDSIAREAIQQDVRLLAHLLSTDELDIRAASGNFRIRKSHRRPGAKARSSTRPTRPFSKIVSFYINETRGRMVILGGPGSGKTVLAATLTVGLLELYFNASPERPAQIAIPCLLNLPSWDPMSQNLADWLEIQIAERFRINRKIARILIDQGRVFPVLDGLDEMGGQDAAKDRSNRAALRINDYIALTPRCRIVVICRSGPGYYEQLQRRISNSDEIEIECLKPSQIIEYIKMHCADQAILASWQPVIDVLASRSSRLVVSVLDTPWRMSAAVTFSLFGGDPANLLPSPSEMAGPNRIPKYWKRIELLLMEAFIKSRVTIHRKGGASVESRITYLRLIADMLIAYENSKHEGSQILLHQWWKVVGGRKMIAAQMTAAWLLLHVPIFILGDFFAKYIMIRNGFSFVVLFANYGTIMLFCLRYCSQRQEPISFHWETMRSARGRRAMAIGLLLAAIVGASSGIVDGAFYGIGFSVIFVVLFILILASVGPDPENVTRPVAILIDDRNFAILVGLAVGAYATLYYVTFLGLAEALTFAAMCVIGSLSASYYARYIVALCYGRLRGLPWRFAHFLNSCYAAGILRMSGPGYQFRHQELLDYLGNS